MNLSNHFALNVDPSQALPETYNYGLVLLSYLVAVLGSYAFLQFATRIAELRDAGLRYSWLVIGAIAMGGGIWAMHFIGMLAHILPIPVAYDPWVTALSIVPAILAAGMGTGHLGPHSPPDRSGPGAVSCPGGSPTSCHPEPGDRSRKQLLRTPRTGPGTGCREEVSHFPPGVPPVGGSPDEGRNIQQAGSRPSDKSC